MAARNFGNVILLAPRKEHFRILLANFFVAKLPQKCPEKRCLNAGFDFARTNVRIRWNPVYKAFHRIHLCGNERSGS